jgi:hypothetical protein
MINIDVKLQHIFTITKQNLNNFVTLKKEYKKSDLIKTAFNIYFEIFIVIK